MRTALSAIMVFALISTINAQDGNVGIGIDTPGAKLHVQDGNIKVVNPDRPWLIFDHPPSSLNGGLQWWLNGDTEMELFYDGINEDLRFWDSQAGVSRMTLKRTGNLGIGTSTPTSALEINGQLEIGEYPYSTIKSRGDNGQFRIWSSYTPFKGAYILANGADFPADAGSMYFTHGDYTAAGPPSLIYFRYASDSAITTQAVLTATGEFGIGTASPLARLHVQDSAVLFTGTLNISNPSPLPVEGSGVRFMWYPDKAAFRAGEAYGDGWDLANIGSYSFATGAENIASGYGSSAIGIGNIASGSTSFAGGNNTVASGVRSMAFGASSIASGGGATALGQNTKAEALLSVAMGRYNVGGGSAQQWILNESVFEIGIGSSDTARANALTVLKNGKTGIGTANPVAKLHVDDGPVLFTGVFNDPSPIPPPIEGAGNRLMWYPDKAAFRAGLVDGAQWNQDSIGDNSFATGENTVASGWRSVAMGYKSRATGTASFAVGGTATAANGYAAAFGSNTLASGGQSFASGFGSKAESWASAAFGRYNLGGGAPTVWNATDPIFEIGIGSGDDNRANAITVLKNGNTGIGIPTPSFPLHVETDSKLRSAYFYNEFTSASSTFGLYAGAFGGGPGTKHGGAFDAYGAGNENIAVKANAQNATKNVAIYGYASGGATNWAAHFDNGYVIVDDRIGVGVSSPIYAVDVITSTLSRAGYFHTSRSTTSAIYGIYAGASSTSAGDKRGGQFSATGGTGENIGVRALAINGTSNIAVYGSATGGTTNWAAHFDDGNVIVDDRLGIATTNPAAELHVNGTLQLGSFEQLSDGGGAIISANSSILPVLDNSQDLGSSGLRWNEVYAANGVVTTSDRNQKTDIEQLGYGLQQVMELEPVTYKWAEGPDRRTHIGLIAQDVLNVIPEVVVTHNKVQDEEGNITEVLLDVLGMRYSDLIPVLIKGMQEQQSVIQQLTEENAELKANQIKIIEALEAAGIQIEN